MIRGGRPATSIFVLAISACGITDAESAPDVAGQYEVTHVEAVEGQPEFQGGTLFLGEPTFADTVLTPGGPRPASCVHELPSGSHVDANDVVTTPSGERYQLALCVPAAYVLSLSHGAAGEHEPEPFRSRGRYEWRAEQLVLTDSAGSEVLTGSVHGTTLRLSDGLHVYGFSRVE